MSVTPFRPHDIAARVPPYNTDAEQALLGAIFINNDVFHRITGFIRAEHFGNAVHGRIFAAAARLISTGAAANPVTLKNLFDQDGALQEIGGAQYLARLATAAMTVINVEDYARIIVDLAKRREFIVAAEDALEAAYTIDLDRGIGGILAEYQGRVTEISRTAINGHDRIELINPTSWTGLPVPQREWMVAPWIPMKRATGLYGAPGTGKTLLMQMLCTAAAIGKPWLGLRVRRCKSVLLYCEDDEDEMHARQDAINRFYDCTYDDLGDMHCLPRLGDDNTLMSFEQGRGFLTPFFHQLSTEIKRIGALLVIVDTCLTCSPATKSFAVRPGNSSSKVLPSSPAKPRAP